MTKTPKRAQVSVVLEFFLEALALGPPAHLRRLLAKDALAATLF